MKHWLWMMMFAVVLPGCEEEGEGYQAPACALLEQEGFEPLITATPGLNALNYQARVGNQLEYATYTFEIATKEQVQFNLSGQLTLGVVEVKLLDAQGTQLHRAAMWPGGTEGESATVQGTPGTWSLEVRHGYSCGTLTAVIGAS